ncbi:hypothetical protein SCACP_17070 [Sporomusa carbonis]|uniref:hypothetical protein n=1 Tax=Sporomusa carbonis TaxID=3076075 RepID=UPI003A65271E
MKASIRDQLHNYLVDEVESREEWFHARIKRILSENKTHDEQIQKIGHFVALSFIPGLLLNMFEKYDQIKDSHHELD